jgi:hypothetical protein
MSVNEAREHQLASGVYDLCSFRGKGLPNGGDFAVF